MVEQDYELGSLEFVFEVTDRKTGDKERFASTPAMWALANEYLDTLNAKGGHTSAWIIERYLIALCMKAAAAGGLINKFKGMPSLEKQAEFVNKYDFDDVSDDYRDSDGKTENPTETDPAENPAQN